MSFLDYLVSVDVRTTLMDRMMRTVGVDRQLKALPDHDGVVSRAVDGCRACGRQDECSAWLDEHLHAEAAPDYCRNADLIATTRDRADLIVPDSAPATPYEPLGTTS